eukprot:Rhum_TRINITY_DN19338_c0_g1::Rhum_TRINITY_DN19338_c0_g1_i1::g.169807::m.169807
MHVSCVFSRRCHSWSLTAPDQEDQRAQRRVPQVRRTLSLLREHAQDEEEHESPRRNTTHGEVEDDVAARRGVQSVRRVLHAREVEESDVRRHRAAGERHRGDADGVQQRKHSALGAGLVAAAPAAAPRHAVQDVVVGAGHEEAEDADPATVQDVRAVNLPLRTQGGHVVLVAVESDAVLLVHEVAEVHLVHVERVEVEAEDAADHDTGGAADDQHKHVLQQVLRLLLLLEVERSVLRARVQLDAGVHLDELAEVVRLELVEVARAVRVVLHVLLRRQLAAPLVLARRGARGGAALLAELLELVGDGGQGTLRAQRPHVLDLLASVLDRHVLLARRGEDGEGRHGAQAQVALDALRRVVLHNLDEVDGLVGRVRLALLPLVLVALHEVLVLLRVVRAHAARAALRLHVKQGNVVVTRGALHVLLVRLVADLDGLVLRAVAEGAVDAVVLCDDGGRRCAEQQPCCEGTHGVAGWCGSNEVQIL